MRFASITFICCEYCDQPMKEWMIYVGKKDKNGKLHDVHFLHYRCRKPFEKLHKGKWLFKGMPAAEIEW